MDTAQWPQERVVKPMEEMVVPHGTTCSKQQQQQQLPSSSLERKIRPQKEHAINCPRCNSTNTKFCYYNNYSLSQPRYFCKTCRRYWTEGGSLRNIPVGGGSRKNKRSSSSTLTSSNTSISSNPSNISSSNPTSSNPKNLPDLILHHHQNPNGQDLNLGFSTTAHDFKTISELIQVPNFSSFLPMHIPSDVPNSVFSSSGFSLPEFKPSSLGFSLDGLGIGGGDGGGGGGGYGSLHGVQESSGRLLFPFEDLKQGSNATASGDQNRNQNGIAGDSTAGYWSGILRGGDGGGGGGGGGEGSW